MEAKTIVAIEIGSSKIKGAVGSLSSDGRLTVLALESVPATDNVRYGRVQNIREVSAAVNDIICRLEDAPAVSPRRIRALAVGLGGRSLAGIPARASLKFPKECEITEKQVQRLAFEATRDYVGDKHVEATVPRMFFVNNAAVRQPVGIFGETLSGDFVMISCGRETRQNLDRIKYDRVESADITYIVAPTALADMVLTPDEKKLGTALVDFGSETSTVAVYKNDSLAFVCTIPMGSRLITTDLKNGLGITEEAAETLKHNIAANPDSASELEWGYVHARAGEIAANVMARLEDAGYASGEITKIVLAGAGANLEEFGRQLTSQTKLPVRRAEMPAEIIFRVAGRNHRDNIDVVALLAAAARRLEQSCLTAVAPPPAPAADTAVDDNDDSIVETDIRQSEQGSDTVADDDRFNPVYVTAEPITQRTAIDEDDSTLLKDDDDDDANARDETEGDDGQTGRRRRFWFFRPKGKPVEAQTDEPDDDEADDDDYADDTNDTEIPDPDTDDSEEIFGTAPEGKTSGTIDNLRDRFLRLFTPPGENDDDESYNDR